MSELQHKVTSFYRSERVSHFSLLGYNLFLLFGCLALRHFIDHNMIMGLTETGIILSVLLLVSSAIRFYRTFSLYSKANKAIDSSNTNYFSEVELPYFEAKSKKYYTLRGVTTIIIILCFAFIIYNHFSMKSPYLQGALSMVLWQSAVLLTFDLFRNFRFNEYTRQIRKELSLPFFEN